MERAEPAERPSDPARDRPRDDGARRASSGARAELVALVRLTRLDEEIARMLGALGEIVERLDKERADLAAFADLLTNDRGAIARRAGEKGDAPKRRERLRHNQEAYAEQAHTFELDQREALELSARIQTRMVEAGEQRQALLASVSRETLKHYEAATRAGIQPVLVPELGGRCPACGAGLGFSRRLVSAEARVVRCCGCPRLLYDSGWVDRDFMAPSLRPVSRARP